MKRTIILDLDGTLTIDDKTLDYPDKPINQAVAQAARSARAAGWGLRVLTARGMRTYGNDVALVEQHVAPVAAAWLDRAAIPHESLQVGKPWCGPGGFYVDDRNLHIEEFTFRFTGPWAGIRVAVRTDTPPPDPARQHPRLARLDRYLEVVRFAYGLSERPAALSGDARIDTPAASDWDLWVDPQPSCAPPAAWFGIHAERLSTRTPLAHLGGSGIGPFALVNRSFDDLAAALDYATATGLTTGSRP